MTALEKHLFLVQQKLDHLNNEMATLLALTSPKQPHAAETTAVNSSIQPTELKSTSGTKSNVGINRFRQLANEQAGHAGRSINGIR